MVTAKPAVAKFSPNVELAFDESAIVGSPAIKLMMEGVRTAWAFVDAKVWFLEFLFSHPQFVTKVDGYPSKS